MTTIVATTSSEYASMLGDQGITSSLMHPNMNKIVQRGSWLIGVCGEDRICDVLQYATDWPKVPLSMQNKSNADWLPWLVKNVVPAVSEAVQNSLHKSYWGTIGDSEALIVSHGRAFLIGETMGITYAEPYWAVGSGSHLAMGALAQHTRNKTWTSKHDGFARRAIETAQIHDPYTRGAITGYCSYPDGTIEEL